MRACNKRGIFSLHHIGTHVFAIGKDTRAAVALEFAVAAPIMFLLILGTIEYCLIMAESAALEYAVITAAREGSTGYNSTYSANPQSIQQYSYIKGIVQNCTHGLLDPNKISFPMPANMSTPNSIVEYTATYPYPVITPLMQKIIGNSDKQFIITATAIVKNEPY